MADRGGGGYDDYNNKRRRTAAAAAAFYDYDPPSPSSLPSPVVVRLSLDMEPFAVA